ncbi:site-specific integrase [Acinetobacter sp. YH01022]|jgi:integrase|uniref:site-specific integrase n=1 Tax=Acinetobacter sp. YH01022 TaxID=2601036 RepID=UPI0015D3AA0C|nr:site-specific integrase [Acinetobacter sp. YH01022]
MNTSIEKNRLVDSYLLNVHSNREIVKTVKFSRETVAKIICEPHIRFIPKFTLKRYMKTDEVEKKIQNKKYIFESRDKNNEGLKSYVAQFPVIIESNGQIWRLGNLYFISYMLSSTDISGTSLKSVAIDLLDYYKFIVRNELSFFSFPKINKLRATFLYRNYLLNEFYERRIHKSTASRRINRTVDFYNRLLTDGFMTSKDFDNEPFERILKKITLNNKFGSDFQKIVNSSDIAINTQKKNVFYDAIHDDGRLRPMTDNQQKNFLEFLHRNSNRQLQLICYFSLTTGARLQTICTLRVKDIKSLMSQLKKSNSHKQAVHLRVGGNTGIDTKRNKEIILEVPYKLIIALNNFINSEEWEARASKNYYGATDDGYVFIAKSGLPYYTSRKEIIDVKNDINRKQETIRRGESVIKNTTSLIKKIQENYEYFPNFSFHDLRATFGMNYLKALVNANLDKDQCLIILKNAMGHDNIETTLNYLNYRDVTNEFYKTQEYLENSLFGDL